MNGAQRRAAKAARRKAIVRIKRQTLAAGGQVVDFGDWAQAASLAKASAALLDVAAELENEGDDYKTRYRNLLLAMLAWNLSLVPMAERREQLRRFFDDMETAHGGELAGRNYDALFAAFETTIDQLIYRKTCLHPLDRRRLRNLDLIEDGGDYRVIVLSSLELG